jgi:hypothetical protein
MRRHLAIGTIAYFAIAVVQIPAAVSGIHQLTGLWWFFCVLIGATLGSTPILGSLLGIQGAEGGWGWSPRESYLLFVGVPIFFLALGMLHGALKALTHRLNAHNPG